MATQRPPAPPELRITTPGAAQYQAGLSPSVRGLPMPTLARLCVLGLATTVAMNAATALRATSVTLTCP